MMLTLIFEGCIKLHAKEVFEGCKIAFVRVYVERAISGMKKMKGTLPIMLSGIADQLLCAILQYQKNKETL